MLVRSHGVWFGLTEEKFMFSLAKSRKLAKTTIILLYIHLRTMAGHYGFLRRPNSSCFCEIITTSGRFKCVPQILGSSSIHIFRLLFLPLLITFRRIHERNSFDLGEICLFCFEFCWLIDFLIPIVT